jgi:hypothetical protein
VQNPQNELGNGTDEATIQMDAGHSFVYSLSPGFSSPEFPNAAGSDGTTVQTAVKITSPLVNMYRMTSDWHGWDGPPNYDGLPGWPNHFALAGEYSSYQGALQPHQPA